MRSFNISRTLFQLCAFGLFVYQFQNSMRKYITGPIIQLTSTTTLDEIQKPLIYLCQEGQFDYTEARNIGYRSLTEFTMGKLVDSDNYTWNGRYGNISYHEIVELLFNADYSNTIAMESNTGDILDYDYAHEDLFYILPKGFCLNVTSTKKVLSITITKKSVVYLVDPYAANEISIYGSKVAKIKFGPTDIGFYEGVLFDIEVEIHDLRIHDGKTCMDYERIGTSYDSCVQNEMNRFLLDWYDCLPPWFPQDNNDTCEAGKVMEIRDDNYTMHNQFAKFISGKKMNILKPCLPSCVTMHYRLYEVDHYTNRIGNAHVQVDINDEIIVHTDAYAYDIFSLIVDLGSSLGLWLGLSALSIFDTLVELYTATKRKYCH